ncbi:hypothetical protein [Bradyrhizobium genosp. P]|uniref:hypothetical protein n=1 Tax=Bradyrhizobium genosp. P TaxID=83641 RepID=UPI003CEEFCC3
MQVDFSGVITNFDGIPPGGFLKFDLSLTLHLFRGRAKPGLFVPNEAVATLLLPRGSLASRVDERT